MKQLFLAALRSELASRDISQKDIADKLYKSPTRISEWLNKGASLKNLDEVMTAFSITLSDLKKYF